MPLHKGIDVKRALLVASAYFLALFTLGFVLGTIRVLFIAPRFGPLAATAAEVPIMLIAAFWACRWSMRRWRVPSAITTRLAMALWFLVLLFVFETLLGAALFGRTMIEQWAALATPAGLIGLAAQVIAALLPTMVGRRSDG
jgi:hypothetical protein